MEHDAIVRLHSEFENCVNLDDEANAEYWMARDLQKLLGYTLWQNFSEVILRAIVACDNSGQHSEDHFIGSDKMVEIGSGARREIADVKLTRYACYLIAQNGDPNKEQIAFAQTYFAVQTRRMEVIEQRLNEIERVKARKKLTLSERELSGLISGRLRDDRSFGIIRSKGDKALFGGNSTQDMKHRLNVPRGRALADFLPTITIKAKDFANEITNVNIKRSNLNVEGAITREHVKSNQAVRRALTERGICPESLPAAEDVKKVERRVAKKLPAPKKGAEGR